MLPLTENQAAGAGILVLMLLVGAAVGIFVYYGMKLSAYEYIGKEAIETAYGVDGMVKERWERFKQTYAVMMVLGIVLCVLSVIPIFISIAVYGDNDFASGTGTAFLLVFVAVGVFLIVRASIIKGGYDKLLQRGDYTREIGRASCRERV